MTQFAQAAPDGGPTVGVALAGQARANGHAPLLTYYDDAGGERTELSYATLQNWAAKTANLLVEEAGVTRGSRITLDVVDHWTGAVIAVGAWLAGAVVTCGWADADSADVVVVAEDATTGPPPVDAVLVVVGAGMGGRLTAATTGIAFGDEVLAFGDDYDDPAVAAHAPALVTNGAALRHRDLLDPPQAGRLLVTAPLPRAGVALARAVAAGGSLVWCPRGAADLAGRAAAEQASHRLDDHGGVVTL